jgi:hypothetical protein
MQVGAPCGFISVPLSKSATSVTSLPTLLTKTISFVLLLEIRSFLRYVVSDELLNIWQKLV